MPTDARAAVVRAGTAIGIGMGGFVDGLLFHQVLQIHNTVGSLVTNENRSIGDKKEIIYKMKLINKVDIISSFLGS